MGYPVGAMYSVVPGHGYAIGGGKVQGPMEGNRRRESGKVIRKRQAGKFGSAHAGNGVVSDNFCTVLKPF